MSRHVLIEGWRGISHSYCLVNQHQILALLGRPNLTLVHRDLPFFYGHWNVRDNAAGFAPARQALVDALPAPDGRRVDAIYRISFPPRAYGGDADRIYCFNTLEYVMKPFFYDGPDARGPFRNDSVTIVTPSNWSKVAFVAAGLKPEQVVVVPHGVDPEAFHPAAAGERAAIRARMGFAADEFVFLNVSTMSIGKGVDALLDAFAVVNQRYPRTRLVLKDQASLYRTNAGKRLAAFRARHPERALTAISILSQNLPVAAMRDLYVASDAYVSPYRAEGFNLPPLEAAACGTPIAVTAGGPTDDYVDASFALKIASRPGVEPQFGGCLEPEPDAIVECMACLVERRTPAIDMAHGARLVRGRHTWARAADRLAALFQGVSTG